MRCHLYLSLVCAMFPCWFAMAGETTASDLSDRLDELELNQSLNPIRFNGELQTRYDKMSLYDANDKKQTPEIYRLRFRLDMSATASKNLTFYGRLATSKAFNEFVNATDKDGNYTNVGGHEQVDGIESQSMSYRGPQVWLERAYFNYTLPGNVVFSMGRLPTVEGSPLNLTYGTAEMGSYPVLAYSTTLDGFALTYNWDNLVLRAIYHPQTTTARTGGNLPYPTTKFDGSPVDMTNDIKTAMLDYTNTTLAVAKKVQLTVQYVQSLAKITDQYLITGALNSALQQTKAGLAQKASLAQQGGLTETAAQLNALSAMVGGLSAKGTSLKFGYDGLVLYGEMARIANTGLSIGLTGHRTTAKSKGVLDKIVDDPTFKQLPSDITNGFAFFGGGAMTDKSSANTAGSAFWSVLSYQFSSDNLKNPTLGAEYFKSDKNYLAFNGDVIDPIGFLKVQGGSATHIFYVQPIDTNFKMRLGYMSKKSNYPEGVQMGPIKELAIKRAKTSAYLELLASF